MSSRIDPTERDIPNLGVAKVKNPEDARDWATLEWELRSFVCEGEYERGLERILDQFLSHLGQAEQPAVWVSGFYGSGKSHLMRVLEYLWRDYRLPSGVSARTLTTLPSEIEAHLKELSAAGKRAGGPVVGRRNARFRRLRLRAACVPRRNVRCRRPSAAVRPRPTRAMDAPRGHLRPGARLAVEATGKSLSHVLRNLYVSPVLAQALIDAGASFGDTPG